MRDNNHGYGQIIWTKALVNFPGPGFLQQKLSFLTIGWSIIIDQLSLDQVNYHGPLRFSNTHTVKFMIRISFPQVLG